MLTIVNKKTWRTCDFPVWERVKHIVPVYNAHLLQNKESGQNPVHYTTLNMVLFFYPLVLRRDFLWYTTVRPSIRLSVRLFHMSRSNLRTPWPIHFKFHREIGIDGLTVCILYGEISNFHSRVMGLYSSNCRRFFVCHAVN